jgi:hypothetical protein
VDRRRLTQEFKWRLATEEFASSGGLVTGTLENWDKKSWELVDKQQERAMLDAVGKGLSFRWVEAGKNRRQRRYDMSGDVLRSKERVDVGLVIELTELFVAGNKWWSIGIDLIGDGTELPDKFKRHADALLARYPGPKLDAEHSYGYPAWVNSQVDKGAEE